MPDRVRAALLQPASGKRAHLPPIMFTLYDALLAHVRTSRAGVTNGVDLQVGQTNVSEEQLALAIGMPGCRQQVRTALDEMVRRGVITRANLAYRRATITLVDFEEIDGAQPSNQPSWALELAERMWGAVRGLRARFSGMYAPASRDVVPMRPWEQAFRQREPGALELIARIAEEDNAAQAQQVCEHVLGHLAQQAEIEFTCKWLSDRSFTRGAWSFARMSAGAPRLPLDTSQPTTNQQPTLNENLEREHTPELDRGLVPKLPDPVHDGREDRVQTSRSPRPAESGLDAVPTCGAPQPSERLPEPPMRPAAEVRRPPAARGAVSRAPTGEQDEIARLLALPSSQRTPRRPDETLAEWAAREQAERHELLYRGRR